MTDPAPKDVTPFEPAAEASAGSSFLRKAFRWAFFGFVVIFVASLVAIAFPLEGAIAGIAAVPVLVAQSCGILLVLMSAAWFAFFSTSSWRIRGPLLAVILIPLIAFAASIRDIDFTADMVAVPVFRWQKPQTQVVEEYRKMEAVDPSASKALTVPEITPEDMPGYRGTMRDGIVIGPKLREDWAANPPKELWKRPVGEGYSQCVVVGNLLMTMEQQAEGEATVCYFADSGREAWIHTTPALFEEVQGGPGPRSTPQIDGDRVYSLGATGELACLRLSDGKVIWKQNVLESTRVHNAMWGMTSSPLVVDDRLIVNIGGPIGNGLLSFDKMTGDLQWQTKGVTAKAGDKVFVAATAPAAAGGSGEEHELVGRETALAGYSSPMVAEVDGVRQILNFDGTGLYGHDLADGRVLWEYPFHNSPGVNVAQPMVLDDGAILISASYGLGTMRLRVSHEGEGEEAKWSVIPAWPKAQDTLKVKMASNILHDGFVYGLDEGIMVCIDPETGKRKWKGGRYGHGQFLLTNDRLVVLTDGGAVALVNASPKKHEEIARFQAIPSDAKSWNPIALSRGILYVRNHRWMAAYDLRATE